jgi:hypothetical protein
MANEPTPLRLRVERYDPASDLSVELGRLSFGPRGVLALVSARPPYERLLAGVVEAVNARDELVLKVPPPPGGKPMGVYHLSVARTAPDLLERMGDYLEQKYDLLLMPERS